MMKHPSELTEYGAAVRDYRYLARVKLADHADAVNKSMALLSSIEIGTRNVTKDILEKTISFFDVHGIDASDLRSKAVISGTQVNMKFLSGITAQDKLRFEAFAAKLPEMSESEKKQIDEFLQSLDKD